MWVADWRSIELESVLGGPLAPGVLTERSLQTLVETGARENEQLDFKGSRYMPSRGPRGDWTDEQEFAKDVASFANHRGGVILLGVTEENDVATGLAPIEGVVPATEEQRLRQAMRNYMSPPAEIRFIPVTSSGGGFYLAVVVPPSGRHPHAVLPLPGDKKNSLRYPRRHGADTIWMTESEVADSYRRQFEGRQLAQDKIDNIVNAGLAALSESHAFWLFQAIVPDFSLHSVLNKSQVDAVQNWFDVTDYTTPLGHSFALMARRIPARGKVTFTRSPSRDEHDETTPRENYVELYVDGAAFAAHMVHNMQKGVHGISDIELFDATVLMSNINLQWAAGRVGAWGNAVVVYGMFDARGVNEVFVHPVDVVDHVSRVKISRTRSLYHFLQQEGAVDLSVVDTAQGRLAASYHILSGLLQNFGIAEPRQMKPDGTIRISEFSRWRRDVQEWASARNVEVE